MIIVGDKEMKDNKIALRTRKGGDLGAMLLEEFISKITDEIKNRVSEGCTLEK